MAKIGDIVRFLNSVGGGKIVRIDGQIAHVEDEDGFDVPVLLRECVVVASGDAKMKAADPSVETTPSSSTAPKAPVADSVPAAAPTFPLVETETGDSLNISLAFEPLNIKQLSSTQFEITLVNDSNYFLNFSCASKANDDTEWTLLRAATAEPNLMISLGRFDNSSLNSLERILFQYVAYKLDRPFAAKQPQSVELRIDTTKFCRLHCFKPNPYFDDPVIAYSIIDNDRPAVPIKIDSQALQEALLQKQRADRPDRRPVKRIAPDKDQPLVVDLHINELLDTTAGLSRADMLNRQIDEFRKVMDTNLRNHGRKIIFIHGKGEGVLRQALLKELNHRYKGNDVCDASFREYGYGATQVTIR